MTCYPGTGPRQKPSASIRLPEPRANRLQSTPRCSADAYILDARCLADLLATLTPAEALAAYDAIRRPATADIVASKRLGGPERVIDLIATLAPAGFATFDVVAPEAELAAIVRGYARLAGFQVTPLANPNRSSDSQQSARPM